MGSTGLHLAANEQYLVGETMAEQAAVDMNDVQTGNHIPIRRVAVSVSIQFYSKSLCSR